MIFLHTDVCFSCWQHVSHQREYLDWLSNQLGFSHVSDLYRLKIADIATHQGAGLLSMANNPSSVARIVASAYPEYQWKSQMFQEGNSHSSRSVSHLSAQVLRHSVDKQRQFLNKIGGALGVTVPEKWYSSSDVYSISSYRFSSAFPSFDFCLGTILHALSCDKQEVDYFLTRCTMVI